jgi:hypothetical protein
MTIAWPPLCLVACVRFECCRFAACSTNFCWNAQNVKNVAGADGRNPDKNPVRWFHCFIIKPLLLCCYCQIYDTIILLQVLEATA